MVKKNVIEQMIGLLRTPIAQRKGVIFTPEECSVWAEELETDFGKRSAYKQMKDTIEITVKIDAGGYPYIPATELYDYTEDKPLAKEGDKVKLVIIKED